MVVEDNIAVVAFVAYMLVVSYVSLDMLDIVAVHISYQEFVSVCLSLHLFFCYVLLMRVQLFVVEP